MAKRQLANLQQSICSTFELKWCEEANLQDKSFRCFVLQFAMAPHNLPSVFSSKQFHLFLSNLK
jgi:hypothetical protein